MNGIALIEQYFPNLSEQQKKQFAALPGLYAEWNQKINVVSRKDIENIVERHILHSLTLAHFFDIPAGKKVLDMGTGGGFPGIPLAIMYPEVEFVLADGIGKKILVVNEVAKAIGLSNVCAKQIRVEQLPKKQFDFITARAVTRLDKLLFLTQGLLKLHPDSAHLLLKGGDVVHEEISEVDVDVELHKLTDHFNVEFFAGKYALRV